jgi:proline dehydrogenase
LVVWWRGETWLRSILLYLSGAAWARTIVTGFGPAWSVASRFVAGESVDEAMAATRQLHADGLRVALDYLGESVTDAGEAIHARDQILTLIDRIGAESADGYVSVKLSQLGLKIDENLALENLRAILQRARAHNCRVRIDMEESALVDITLDLYRRLRAEVDGGAARSAAGAGDTVGIVIQSALYRTDADAAELVEEGAWVRLVKGAYKEPATIAYPAKKDVDQAFVRQARLLLSAQARAQGVRVAIATHDDAMINAVIAYARANGIRPEEFEFQMLYGVRRERQRELVAQGWPVRVYVPYGTAWYPYFMRRLAERPANLWFFVSNFFRA